MRLIDLLRRLLDRMMSPTPKPPPPPPVPPVSPPPPPPSGGARALLLAEHNAERAPRGLTPYKESARLDLAAQAHADDMAATGVRGHTGSDGSSPFDRIRRAGYQYSSAGENVAFGYATVEAVMHDWMDSAGHRANILGRYTEVGFGTAVDARGRRYWAACFATPTGTRAFVMHSVEDHFPAGITGPDLD